MFDDEYSPEMLHWFGDPWPFIDRPAPVCEDVRFKIEVPVGERCLGCNELIDENDSGVRMPYVDINGSRWAYFHAECSMRNVIMCPRCMGILPGPHPEEYAPGERREEGRLLMRWSQERVTR